MLIVEKIGGWDNIKGLKAEWDNLAEMGPQDFYLSFSWIMHWYNHFGREFPSFFLRVRGDGKTLAIFPIITARGTWRRLSVRILRLCQNGHSIFGGIIAPKGEIEISKAVWQFLRQQNDWDVFHLQNVPKKRAGHVFLGLAGVCGLGSITTEGFQYYLPFENSWESYWDSQSRNFRKNFRSTVRKLEKEGEISFWVSRTPEEFIEGMQILFEVDALSWKKDSGEVMANDPLLMSYYEGIGTAVAADSNKSFVTVLRVGGKPVAAMLGIDSCGWIFGLKLSFVGDRENSSPGFSLLVFLIKEAWVNGKRGFYFLSGDQIWSRFKGQKEDIITSTVFNDKPYGRLLFGIEKLVRKTAILSSLRIRKN